MSILEALVFGLIQGLTEFIPVSSSGHLIIAHEIFGTNGSTLLFDVALHIGTLLALVLFFYKDLIRMVVNISSKNAEGRLSRIIVVATIPAAVVGFLFSDWIDDTLRKPITVVITMTLMAVIMLIVEKYSAKKRSISSANMKDGISVGFVQALSLIPGISRSGATITAGMVRGLTRADAARFSFLMAVPITAGAIAGSILGATPGELGGHAGVFIAGIVASLLSGFIAIRFLLKFLGSNSLNVFAYYRIALAVVVLIFLV